MNSKKLEIIEKMIISYLKRNPMAMDTLEGITRFWLSKEKIETTIDEVSSAVEKLLKKELIQVLHNADGTHYYKINRQSKSSQRR